MSKKIFNVFFVVLFLSSFCFIGCTDLLAPKAQTDISLKIDLSKIIKSSRNEGGSQGASSLGDNPTIKVAIYDAKDYDKATNSTENLTLITQAQTSVGGDGIARVKLSDIPVGIDAIVFAELSFTDENSTQVVYAGNSGVFKVKASDNKVSLVLKKVANSETSPDNTNTPYENYTLYKKTENGEEVSNVTGATISTSSTSETKVTVTNPASSESVWTYFVKPENKTRFTKNGNYKVSVELKADKTTVVGIAAARADYFFTVNSDWTTCEFNTGYLIGNENHQFTIGLGLSSEIQIRNLKIEKLSEIDTTEPSLVFDISRHAINSYLENNNNRPKKIVELTKETKYENNLGYTITINAPLSHSESTTEATVQDVKLHLRSYATENTGANRVSFNITNTGSNDFETSVMADTASDKSISWNNGTNPINPEKFGSYEIDFPNYVQNDELNVGVITTSTSTSQDNSTSFTLSNFKVEKAGDSPFSDKIFAIQDGENWTKIDDGDPISKEVKIITNTRVNFDVGLFNGFNDDKGTPSSFDDVTRFFYTGDTNIKDDLIYSVNNDNPNEPKFIISNDSLEDKIVKISLNENYEVVIEEVTGTTITSWADLSNQIAAINGATTTTGFVIANNLTATSTITVSKPVKIISDKNVTITRGNSSDGGNFEDSFFRVESAGNLELAGTEENQITLDGENQSSTNYGGAVYVSGGTFTMNDGVTISKCNATDGGAIYITDGGTFNMNGGTITGCSAINSGGGVWMDGGSSFTMSGNSKIENCKVTSYEGGGVYVTDVNNPCTFKMLEDATITRCSAVNGGGGVSYGCGTNGTFEISGTAEISNNVDNGNGGGGIYLYGKLTMNGGTISGNQASNGAGVYVRNVYNVLSSLSMSGNAVVDSNNDVYLESGTTVKVAGNLTAEHVATITPENYEEVTPVITAADSSVTLANQVGKFTLSNEEYCIDSNGMIASAINYAAGLTYQNVSGSDTLYISSAEGLITFRNIVNGSFDSDIIVRYQDNSNSTHTFSAGKPSQNINAVLENDITISDEWTPIGKYANDTSKKPYSGTFDGGGKTVTFYNITHSDTSMYSSGLFQMVSGSVKNLVIDGSISRTVTGYIGGVVGYLDGGTIENCVNKASISNVATNGTGGIVGVIGNTGSSLVGCVNMGDISSRNSSVGGIVGGSTGTASNISISKCINVGEVTASYTVAGIYGNLSSNQSGFTLSDCINLGKISMTTNDASIYSMAGIINNTPTCTVSNCVSVGLLQNSENTMYTIGSISSTPSVYTNCYFNTEVISSPTDQGTTGNNRKTTAELCALTTSDLSNWSCVTDNTRYPLPNIESTLPVGTGEKSIWNQILDSAKVEISGSGGGIASYQVGDVLNSVSFDDIEYQKSNMIIVANEEITITGTNSPSWNGFTAGNIAFGVFIEGRNIKLSPFAMGQYEVTQELYQAVMTDNPSYFNTSDTSDTLPVEKVSWYEIIAFCNSLSEKMKYDKVYFSDEDKTKPYTLEDANSNRTVYMDISKNGYRLPTEAEWEYAARFDKNNSNWNYSYSGINTSSTTPIDASTNIDTTINSVGWYSGNANSTTQIVGQQAPNGLGLYDMTGNVWELCWDPVSSDMTVTENDDSYLKEGYIYNPQGGNQSNCTMRVRRGGGFNESAYMQTVLYRKQTNYDYSTSYNTGFRLCRSIVNIF